jgi:hypothetical protein
VRRCGGSGRVRSLVQAFQVSTSAAASTMKRSGPPAVTASNG